jgi:hypothetical protein
MKLHISSRWLPRLILAASLLICLGVWRWAESVLVPVNTQAAQSGQIPIGNHSDLYPRWFGSRELLLHHRDPYSAEVTRGIQRGFYGRELDPHNPADPTDQAAFAYPLYVVFLLAPTVTLPFATLQAICRWLFLAGIAATVPVWMYGMGFRTQRSFVLSGMVLAISSYPAVLEFHMQNLAALVAVLLAFAAAAAARGYFFWCGFLLALSTIKPQLAGLFVLWLLVWTAGRWQQRKHLALGFAGTMLALVLAAEIALPHWIPEFVAGVRAYTTYATDPSILQFFFGSALAWVVAFALCCVLLFVVWRRRESPAGSTDFGWASAWVATVTLLIAPVTVYNQVLLVPAFLVLLLDWKNLRGLVPRALVKGTFACQSWQWGVALVLSIGSVLVSPQRLWFLAMLPVLTLIALPPLVLLAIAASTISLQSERKDSSPANVETQVI